MTDWNEHGHPEPPFAGDETTTLLGSLDRLRATAAWKCGALDAASLRAARELVRRALLAVGYRHGVSHTEAYHDPVDVDDGRCTR